jgi:hypothetical protein
MGYIQEAKEETQSIYGHYCNLCRELLLDIKPYHKFTILDYNRVKDLKKKTLKPMT